MSRIAACQAKRKNNNNSSSNCDNNKSNSIGSSNNKNNKNNVVYIFELTFDDVSRFIVTKNGCQSAWKSGSAASNGAKRGERRAQPGGKRKNSHSYVAGCRNVFCGRFALRRMRSGLCACSPRSSIRQFASFASCVCVLLFAWRRCSTRLSSEKENQAKTKRNKADGRASIRKAVTHRFSGALCAVILIAFGQTPTANEKRWRQHLRQTCRASVCGYAC